MLESFVHVSSPSFLRVYPVERFVSLIYVCNIFIYGGLYKKSMKINIFIYGALFKKSMRINIFIYGGLFKKSMRINIFIYGGLFKKSTRINIFIYGGLFKESMRICCTSSSVFCSIFILMSIIHCIVSI